MAARYVNPSNVVAQGQDFYTGLPAQDQQQAGQAPRPQMRAQQQAGGGPGLTSGSYAGHGGGGGANVMGRGSGGSAGVGADRTGSDSSKSWNYKPQLNIQIARDEEKESSRVKPEPEADPPGKPKPTTKRPIPGGDDDWDPGEHPDPPFGPHPPMGPSWGGPDKPKPMGELGPGNPMGELGPGKPMGELGPGKPMGELNPAPPKAFPEFGWSPMPQTEGKGKRIQSPEEKAKRAAGVITSREDRQMGRAMRSGPRAKIGGTSDDLTFIGLKDEDITDSARESTGIGSIKGETKMFKAGGQGMWSAFKPPAGSRAHSR